MAVLVAPILLLLFIGSSQSSLEQNSGGCESWTLGRRQGDVCCNECKPGNRLVASCGAKPQDLCTPCKRGTYTQNPKSYTCSRCTQCEGAQVLLKECTTTRDTQCGCKEGLVCGDDRCSFCAKKCGKGEEPTDKRSCRPCANGTFNDQIHHKCKPWSIKCPDPDQVIAASGNAFTDIRCVNVSRNSLKLSEPLRTDSAWPLVLSVFPSVCLMALSISFILTVYCLKRKKKPREKITEETEEPTDDPKTLIAIECSFHEAQEEQGSDSFASKDSRDQLVV